MSEMKSAAEVLGKLIAEELVKNKHFYLFSPDETTSNKLAAVFEENKRAWSSLRMENWDLPEDVNGHVVEILSENTLFAAMVGHVLAEEPAMMTSYEAFFNVITSQVVQHLKFLKQSKQVAWRPEYPAVNLLSTSTCWRQDHNGFSHQAPTLISTILNHPGREGNCIFPASAADMLGVFRYMMTSNECVNLVTFNKTEEPVYEAGEFKPVRVFGFASNGDSENLDSHMNDTFDVVFTAVGDIATRETLYAMKILRQDFPKAKFRFVNIGALCHGRIGTNDQVLSQKDFERYFKVVTPVIANFHGYPEALRSILENYTMRRRLHVHGYEEEGSTTTPFEMLSLNHASRYDLAAEAAEILGNAAVANKYRQIIAACHTYAKENGVDHKVITDFRI